VEKAALLEANVTVESFDPALKQHGSVFVDHFAVSEHGKLVGILREIPNGSAIPVRQHHVVGRDQADIFPRQSGIALLRDFVNPMFSGCRTYVTGHSG